MCKAAPLVEMEMLPSVVSQRLSFSLQQDLYQGKTLAL